MEQVIKNMLESIEQDKREAFAEELRKFGFQEPKMPKLLPFSTLPKIREPVRVEATNPGFCKHLYQRGKLLGVQCRVATDNDYCYEHAKQSQHVLYKCTSNMFVDHKLVPCDTLTHNPRGRCRRHKLNSYSNIVRDVKNDPIELSNEELSREEAENVTMEADAAKSRVN
jgi:hypothetical protein